MKIISKGRATGKTTGLIYTSEATGYPIVVPTEFSIKYVLDMAEKMGCEIPTPVTVQQLRHDYKCGNPAYDNILLDSFEAYLRDALTEYLGGRNIVCGTTSLGKDNIQVTHTIKKEEN